MYYVEGKFCFLLYLFCCTIWEHIMQKVIVTVNHPHPSLFSNNKVGQFKTYLSDVIDEKYGLSVEVRPVPELFGTPGHRNDPTSVRVIYPEHYEGPVLNQDEILLHVNNYLVRLFGKTEAQQSADVINGSFKMFTLLLNVLLDPLRPKRDTGS